jgi:glyceraldehyde 3-phosphate dehydrogenase
MKTVRVGINGFGRIGRAFMRQVVDREDVQVVAINDLGDAGNLAYMLKYDSVYGKMAQSISASPDAMHINESVIALYAIKDPTLIPWKSHEVDVVVECTGFFDTYEKAAAHIQGGARRVVISSPVKDSQAADGTPLGKTVLMGVNEEMLSTVVVSANASCTTNAASPLIGILDEFLGIAKAALSTTHAYTSTQRTVDGPDAKDYRRGRAAAINISPTSTGAAVATTLAYPQLEGKFDGIALRVPVPAGSIVDITFVAKRKTTVEEVNTLLIQAAQEPRWKDIFAVSIEPLVSQDIVGDRHASIADLTMTRVIDGDLVKVLAWYDNEAGYTATLVQHVIAAGA